MEKVIDKDREKYFLQLAQQDVKLPSNFDISKLKATTERATNANTNTNEDTNDGTTQDDVNTRTRTNKEKNIVNHLNTLVQQIQKL